MKREARSAERETTNGHELLKCGVTVGEKIGPKLSEIRPDFQNEEPRMDTNRLEQ